MALGSLAVPTPAVHNIFGLEIERRYASKYYKTDSSKKKKVG